MTLHKLGALALLPATILVFHPLGCSGFYQCEDDATCLDPTLPEGWQGYRWMRVLEDVGAAARPCNDEMVPTPYYVPPPEGSFTCPSCNVMFSDDNAACVLPALECWVGATCDQGTKLMTNVDPGGKCAASYNTKSGTVHCRVEGKPIPPTCNVEVGEPTYIPTGPRLDACRVRSTADADCASNETCKAGELGAIEQQCLFADGLRSSCPSGWDTMYHAYASYEDSRTCTKCECTTSCDWAGFTILDSGDCDDDLDNASDSMTIIDGTADSCTTLPTDVTNDPRYGVEAKVLPKARVSPKGGEAMGRYEGKGPVTFCCRG